jgi:serine/threonine-protein kinase SRPK3
MSSSSDSDSHDDDIDLYGHIVGHKTKYILIETLGDGAYATVWLAYQKEQKKYYAIKVQNADDFDDGMDEVDIYKKVNAKHCKYINKLIENFVHKHDGKMHVCMVFELMAGTLFDIVKKGKYADGMPFESAKVIIHQILQALNFLFTEYGRVHPDVKPENVLVVGKGKNSANIINHYEKNKKTKSVKDMMEHYEPVKIDKDSCKIDDVYLDPKNIIVKLTDFTGCEVLDGDKDDTQLTRYYRAPESLLFYKYNERSQLWSVACMFYELLTGDILFDPPKEPGFSRNRWHVYLMIQRLGKIPSYILDSAKRKDYYFRNNKTIKGRLDISFEPLYDVLIKKLGKRQDISRDQLMHIIDFMYKLLNYDPFKRPSIDECLRHPLFNAGA